MTREALSTDAACAGGPARSSGEALVTGVDAKGPAHQWFGRTSNRGQSREETGEQVRSGKQAV